MTKRNAYSAKALESLSERTTTVLDGVVPDTIDYGRGNPLPREIAGRVVANARIVGRKGLRDQVLIVLADYRDHGWSGQALKGEATRIVLADAIVLE